MVQKYRLRSLDMMRVWNVLLELGIDGAAVNKLDVGVVQSITYETSLSHLTRPSSKNR